MTASARGLFHVTGKRSKPVHTRDSLTGDIVTAPVLERRAGEFYATPPEPTRAVLAVEGVRLRQFPAIWEPAAGNGAIVRELEAVGLPVIISDLVDRGCGAIVRDFYAFDEAPAAAIVTNPPFDQCSCKGAKARWIYHALERLRVAYMALLLPWGWPGAAGLADLWRRFPPARVYLMRWRVDFTGQGASPALNAWFVWDCTHRGAPALLMLDRVDARQSDFFGGAL